MLIGWSTGALARGDVADGVALARASGARAIELSALREAELSGVLAWLATAELPFDHVSIHAPSDVAEDAQQRVVPALMSDSTRDLPVIVHPSVIATPSVWRPLGPRLCIENMDKRKVGRNVAELLPVFAALPEARFCLDLGHARQNDTTLLGARQLLRAFGDRLVQIHLSELDAACRHHGLSYPVAESFQGIAHLIPEVPVIIESEMSPQEMGREMEIAASCFVTPIRKTTVPA